jgi:hypothetical protein
MEWSTSKDPWVIDRLEDTWVHSTMPSPAETERTMAQALAASYIRGTLSRSGNTWPLFHPTWTESRAAKYVKDPQLFYVHMKQRKTWRPQKIIHTVGVTYNDAIWETKHDGYFGVFRKVDHPAVFRLSLGVRPEAGGNACTNASFVIKIPRDGVHACDILAMFDFEGQKTGNMFQHIRGTTFNNPVIPLGSQEVGDKFQKKLDDVSAQRAGLNLSINARRTR